MDVLRHPLEGTYEKAQHDLNAVAQGEGRSVSCMLRGTAPGLPTAFTQGTLFVGSDGMTWRRYWRHCRRIVVIPPLDRVITVRRPGGPGEWNIKRGLFRVVEADGPFGAVYLAVPGVVSELVRQAIEGEHPLRS